MLMLMKRYEQAEAIARQVLQGQEGLSGMHEVLAVSLFRQRRHPGEAYEHLERAAAELPIARLLAANALAATGRITEAKSQASGVG